MSELVLLSETGGAGSILRPTWADATGLVASIGCAIHCAAMPILIGYLPAMGLEWLATQGFHQVMAFACGAIAIAAFIPGWRKHSSVVPGALGLVGVGLISFHAFAGEDCCAANGGLPSSDAACRLCSESECGLSVDSGNALASSAQTSSSLLELTQQVTVHAASSGVSDSVEAAPASATRQLTKFITPLGGLFLIWAHIVNHRLACRCCRGERPCETEA